MAEAISHSAKKVPSISDIRGSSVSESMEDRLRESQKMALVGRLAAGVAHDFNNILSATLIHLGLLLKDPQVEAHQKESLKVMENEITRAANLTRQLSAFGRRSQTARVEVFDFNEMTDEVVKMLRHLLRENVIVVFLPARQEVWIKGDVGLLEQLIANLCLLSREAMPKGGTLTLATALQSIPDSDVSASRRAGDFVCVSAISSESATSEKPEKGFGVPGQTCREAQWSLESVQQIVALHNGWMERPPQAGIGVSFRIYFPAAMKPDKAVASSGEQQSEMGGTETILLVEDELYLRRVSTLCLRKLGYAVVEAGDGIEALKLWEKHRDKIDLLFTDFLLPGTDTGLDLAQRMKSGKPSLKVLISSGHGVDFGQGRLAGAQSISHVTKPYTVSDLVRIVRERLDALASSEEQPASL